MQKSYGLHGKNAPLLIEYFEKVFLLQDPKRNSLQEIRNRSDGLGLRPIHVAESDGLHLEILTRSMGAKKIVEIGTLAGYSGACLLRGAGPDAKLWTFEYHPHHADAAWETFRKQGVDRQVTLKVGAALENLPSIQSEGPFDLVFIDADKVNYPKYFDWAVQNLRVGGSILADNTFAWGMIADTKFESQEDEEAVQALREYNEKAANDPRVRSTLLPTGEGLTLSVKLCN
ncbi:MAG: O-methyltransferase [Bdellovibrionales bacterium]|nr:O-methyltransferase [Bdellovibrionales bacterium]